MKIVVLDGYTLNPGDLSWDQFNELGEIKVYDRTAPEDILSRIGDAEIVFTNKTVITREVIEAKPNIRFIGVLAAGYNVVDVEAARDNGISVTNTPGYGSKGVAQMVFAHLLEITNNVALHSNTVKDGKWSDCEDFCYWERPIIDLNNKTMGIIGYGNIGREVGAIARAFGMELIIHDKYAEDADAENVELDVLFKRSDVISLHCPLFPETKEIIRKENIDKMKDGMILVNTSRGPLVNEKELVEAVRGGKIYAAGVDVLESEPPLKENILVGGKGVNVTPHIAWASKDSRVNLMNIAFNNLKAFTRGEHQNVVNK